MNLAIFTNIFVTKRHKLQAPQALQKFQISLANLEPTTSILYVTVFHHTSALTFQRS